MLDPEGFSCTFIWRVHENFSASRLRENQRASFSVNRSTSWLSRTMSSDRNPTFPPYDFHPCPFHVGISLCIGRRAIGMF